MTTLVCKHCDAEDGFYVKEHYSGTCNVRYNADGTFMEDGMNGGLYDNANHKGGKVAYCINCHRSLGKSELFKSN